MKYSELNEKKTHGTPDFPIEFYKLDRTHRQYIMPPHWHAEIELILVLDGRFDLYLNKRHYCMTAGDLAFVNAGTIHHGEPVDCRYECIVFHPEMLKHVGGALVNRYVKPLTSRKIGVLEYFQAAENETVLRIAGELFSLLRMPTEYGELAVYSALYALLHALYTSGAVSESLPVKSEQKQLDHLMRLLEWIEDHYTERITLKMLSKTAGMNEKYLCRFFKAYTSYTPIDYVNRLRIEKAADDLRLLHRSVTEAAFANGFNDSAYFSKLFRQIKGVSPKAYQKSE
jgi:AraC-like DNA-binding protein